MLQWKLETNRNKLGNLLLTNEILKACELKSFTDIYTKYGSKKRHIFQKKTKNKVKTGKRGTRAKWAELAGNSHNYEQKLILAELKKLTDLMKKQEENR